MLYTILGLFTKSQITRIPAPCTKHFWSIFLGQSALIFFPEKAKFPKHNLSYKLQLSQEKVEKT